MNDRTDERRDATQPRSARRQSHGGAQTHATKRPAFISSPKTRTQAGGATIDPLTQKLPRDMTICLLIQPSPKPLTVRPPMRLLSTTPLNRPSTHQLDHRLWDRPSIRPSTYRPNHRSDHPPINPTIGYGTAHRPNHRSDHRHIDPTIDMGPPIDQSS
ncbi:hypothetical protein TKK_0006087 [Trichogramma kaykai]